MAIKKSAFIYFVVFIISLTNAHSIAFIPPIIYVASVSILGLLTNLVLILVLGLAIMGMTNHKYFGKTPHAIAHFFLGWLGFAMITIISTIPVMLWLKPIDFGMNVICSFISALISFPIVFLIKYRKFHLADNDEKKSILLGIVFTIFLIAAISFLVSIIGIEKTPIVDIGANGTIVIGVK